MQRSVSVVRSVGVNGGMWERVSAETKQKNEFSMEGGFMMRSMPGPGVISSFIDDPASTKACKRKRRPASQHTPSGVEGSSQKGFQ